MSSVEIMSSKEQDVEVGQPLGFPVPMNARHNTLIGRLTTLPPQRRSKSPASRTIPRSTALGTEKGPGIATMTRILRNTVVANDVDGATLIIARLKAEGVEKSAGFTIQDISGNGLLQIAAIMNLIPMTRLLLDQGFDINAVDSNHGTALQAAIYMNHAEITKMLLEDNMINVNTKGGYHGCALQVAAFKGSENLVRDLLSHSPNPTDVNIIAGKYGSVLQAAARTGLPSIVALILNSGFKNVNIQGGVYGTALQAAAKGEYTGTKFLRRLSRGRVLRQATNVPRKVSVAPSDYLTVAKMLLKCGAKANICGGKRTGSAINAAASSGQREMLELLLDAGDKFPLRRRRVALMTAITQTVVEDRLPLVKMLVKHETDFDFEAEGSLYNRPLTAAAAMGCKPVVEYLLSAAKDRKMKLMNVESGIFGSALRSALSAPAKETSEYLIEQGADLTSSDELYGNVLHLATFSNLNGAVQLLLQRHVDVDALDENDQTALHIAVFRGWISIVETLLASGAKVNRVDVWGDTPIDIVERRLERDNNPGPSLEDLRKIKQLLLDQAYMERKPELNISFHGPSLFKRPEANQPNKSRARSVYASPKWNPGLGFDASIVDFWDNNGDEYVLVEKLPVDDLLYRNGAVEEIMKKGGSTKETPNLRWIHLPANNMIWVEMLLRVLWAQTHKTASCKSFWGIDPYFVSPDLAPHARFVTPQCERLIPDSCDSSSPLTLKNEPLNTLFIAMPYIHWEPYRAQEAVSTLLDEIKEDSLKMRILRRRTIEDQTIPPRTPLSGTGSRVDAFADPELTMNSRDDKLIAKFVFKRWPLHLRRTLDQYYYSYLADTKVRDGDQVVMRIWNRDLQRESEDAATYLQFLTKSAGGTAQTMKGQANVTKQVNQTAKTQEPKLGNVHEDPQIKDENSPIVMVDQLWIWVIRKDLIVTAFPQRRSDKEDGDLDPDDRSDVLKTIHAYLHSAKRHPIQDAYDLCELITSQAVGILHRSDMISELDFLKIFARQADSTIDQVMTGLSRFVGEYQKFMKWLDLKHRDPEEYVRNFERIFSVTDETTLLREIQDLKDELSMLAAVFEDQKIVLTKAGDTIKMDRQKRIETRSSAFNFSQQSQKHARHVERMRLQAKQAYDNLKDLLDLKQQQASVLEARVSRNQTLASQEQSKTIMVFTIVTIIFLPLTFMTTVFTLPVIEFPRYDPIDGTPNPSGQLKSLYVFLITVGVTAALAGPLIITAFKIKRVQNAWEAMKRVRWKLFPLHFNRDLVLKGDEPQPTWGPHAGFYWKGPLPKRRTNINDISD